MALNSEIVWSYMTTEQITAQTKWLGIEAAARHLGLSISYIRKLVRTRRIPFTRVGDKVLRFDRGALDNWMAAQSCGGEVKYARPN
jgi:excisionase family DNA binding protein